MLNKKIRILDFDGSITKQKQLLKRYESDILDLKGLGPAARYWVNNRDRKIIEERITDSAKEAITFLGSGDFHHISEVLINSFSQQMSLILFDLHPEWDIYSFFLGCGSWLNSILKRKNILKVILVGTSSEDISTFNINSGNLKSLKEGLVEIYPYTHRPSKVFLKRVPENISVKVERGPFSSTIYWHELVSEELGPFFKGLIGRLPSKNVYVSIDKDCLNYDSALTNWEEGGFSLGQLLLMLKLIKENLRIVGLDITGDYSNIEVSGSLKRILSYLDHPRNIKPLKMPEESVTSINERTNLEILGLLTESE
ncbi:MAG: hypothetical protein ABSB18_06585 [Candidatus Omnitrophota bacterium]